MGRPRCPELRNLLKSPWFTSVQWRNQTPGSLDHFFVSTTYSCSQVIDPSHPAAGVAKIKFPFARRDDIGIKLLPMGLLLHESRPFPATPILTWTERVQKAKEAGLTGNRKSNAPNVPRNSSFDGQEQLYPECDYNSLVIPPRRITPRGPLLDLALERAARRVPMSFHISTSKKRMGQFRYMRRGIETRIRAAINLIVAKGAHTKSRDETIRFDANDAGRKWVLQGWAYMFFPTTEVYRMPYAKLVNNLRNILQHVNRQAIRMENDWLNQSLLREDTATSKYSKSIPNLPYRKYVAGLKGNIEADTTLWATGRQSEPHASPSNEPAKPSFECLLDTNPLNEANSSDSSTPAQKDKVKEPYVPPTSTLKQSKAPPKNLGGKEPEVWKQELLAGLGMISRRLPGKRIPPIH